MSGVITSNRLTIDPTVMEEAIRHMRLLTAGARERSELLPLEISRSIEWMMGSWDRAAALLSVAVHGFATADEDDADWVFAGLRHRFVEG